MAKMPPAFLKNLAAKKGAAPGKPGAKLCPGCKDPACKRAGKCAKGK